MSDFMQPEIYDNKQRHVWVETKNGDYIVPRHLVDEAVMDALKKLNEVEKGNGYTQWDGLFDLFVQVFKEYVPVITPKWERISATKPGYVGRLFAPGYMDCTEWEFSRNLTELKKNLKNEE